MAASSQRSVAGAFLPLVGLAAALLAAGSAPAEPAPETTAGGASGPESAPDPLFDEAFELELEGRPAHFPDPFEPVNRPVLRFNGVVDRFFLDPVTRVYGRFVPVPVKRSLRNLFDNLGAPATLVNDVLQLEWKDAAVTAGGFVVNSTIGVAGLFEPGRRVGLERHVSDFGQTLALAGVDGGPYLVFPLLGPSCVRDSVGGVVDGLLQPLTYLLPPTQIAFYGGSSGLATREEHFEELQALKESSVDFYAVLRSAYYQNRLGQIWERREDRCTDVASFAGEPPEGCP
jgi:phospholipid-binding lipoprotein MlaA